MSSFNALRLPDGREVSLSEWLHQPVWSTVEFDNASTAIDLRAFNFTKGQPVSSVGLARRNATDMDTNLVKRKAMNQDESLIVFSVTFEVFALSGAVTSSAAAVAPIPCVSATDLARLQRDLMWELYVGAGIKKPQMGVPFVWLTQSMGPNYMVSGDESLTDRNIEVGTAGEIDPSNQRQLKLPIYIGGFGQNAQPGNSMFFQARLFNAFGGAVTGLRQDIRIRPVLDGLKKRPA